ncbi:unnamed protein product [Rotaria socialis]|uniref:Ig-like domain-containing protein n=1 Tax=Rotaria socialis TaxID=392032 RepID=A0A817X6Z1_9BILA|nr:unnamed protein product [Rotaria socialis]CAF4411370.1 unnamed protein product [Rotaria socialis]
MILNIFSINLLFALILSGSWCVTIEQLLVPIGDSFSFDCRTGDSVYFARKLNDWSEIQEDDEKYSYLNLNFMYLNQENILRLKSNAADSQNIGYYGCRRPTERRLEMSRIYQLILADIDSFYWSYICHAQAGACMRFDDPTDETQSTFEVADKTKVDLFCCASVSGYKNININMNQIGDNQNEITIKRTQELDGSWVVCANQHTFLQRTYSRTPDTFTCELLIDDQVYSSFNSVVTMTDALPIDPDIDSPDAFKPPSKGGWKDDDYFNRQRPPNDGRRGKMTTGKQIAIIIGFIIGGLLLIGLLFFLIFDCRRKKQVLNNSKKNKSNQHAVVRTNKKLNKNEEQNPKEEEPLYAEPLYVEPTPSYENAPIFLRL